MLQIFQKLFAHSHMHICIVHLTLILFTLSKFCPCSMYALSWILHLKGCMKAYFLIWKSVWEWLWGGGLNHFEQARWGQRLHWEATLVPCHHPKTELLQNILMCFFVWDTEILKWEERKIKTAEAVRRDEKKTQRKQKESARKRSREKTERRK